VIPRFLAAFDSLLLPARAFGAQGTSFGMQHPVHGALQVMDLIGKYVWYWGPIFPMILILLVVAWIASRRARTLQGGASLGLLRWFPWMGSMMRGFEAASFADLLALLIEHRVPYPEALVLAGDASGNRGLGRDSRVLAEAIARGEAPGESLRGRSDFPPLLRWVLATAPQQGDLVSALRQMAVRYRGLARHQADKLRVFLPTFLLFAIGATATLAYALALFVPLTTLWTSLAGQNS
jgi:general secretion pathway protein F